jgi:hypothetical protein
MHHSFEIEDAVLHGVECAIVLSNIRFWTAKNKANGRHCHQGRYWTYNSVKAWSELFPYWNENKMRRILENLENSGAILTGNFNENPYDRTKWICINCQIDLADLPNGNGIVAKSTTDNKPNVNTDSKQRAREPSRFDEFWAAYPRKESKPRALKFWQSKKLDAIAEKIIKHVNMSKKSSAWTDKGGQFVPHASTYLNGERYNDEITLSRDEQFLQNMAKINQTDFV